MSPETVPRREAPSRPMLAGERGWALLTLSSPQGGPAFTPQGAPGSSGQVPAVLGSPPTL